MQSLKALNIYLLAMMILFGSILNVHVHSDQLSKSASETSKEIENSSLEGKELLWAHTFFLIHPWDENEIVKISLPSSNS